MKRKVINNNGRDKAFLGSIIGGAASVIGGVASSIMQKKAEERKLKQQQSEQNKLEGIQQANAMTSSYANQDYINDYRKKISLKNGGIIENNKYTDRVKQSNKFRCGGRKKAINGIEEALTGVTGGINGIINSIINKPSSKNTIQKSNGFSYQNPKTNLQQNDYQLDNNNNSINTLNNINTPETITNQINPEYKDRLMTAKMGTKLRRKRS